jgi:hypothetical protein
MDAQRVFCVVGVQLSKMICINFILQKGLRKLKYDTELNGLEPFLES